MIKKCCHSNETFKFQLEKPSLIFIFIQFFNQSQPFKLNPSSNHVHLQKYKYRKKNNSVYFTIINIFLQLNFFNRHQLNELF
jgi:hypothetical protein